MKQTHLELILDLLDGNVIEKRCNEENVYIHISKKESA